MPTSFPASLDAYGDPAGTGVQGLTTPTHSGHHQNHNDAIEAIEAKLGVGASTAAASTVLRGTGAGSTGFGQVATADIAAGAISQSGVATATAGQTTTSLAYVNVTGSPVSLTTTGGTALLLASGSVYHSIGGGLVLLALAIDGVAQPGDVVVSCAAGYYVGFAISCAVVPSAGAHSFSIRWAVQAGTATFQSGGLSVVELKK